MIAKVSPPSSQPARGAARAPVPPVDDAARASTDKQQESPPVEASATHESDPAAEHVPSSKSSGGMWIVILLLLAAGGGGWYFRERWLPLLHANQPAAKAPARVVPVATSPAKKRDLELYLNGLGTVTALKTVVIRSRVDGEIINVAFTEGQIVQEGELLAQIDPRPFEVQRDQAAGQLARDEAAVQVAKLNLERIERLAKTNAASKQEVDNQVALVHSTEGIIKSDKAMVANAELQLTYSRIVSPITGRIGLRLVDVGNIVRANDSQGLAVVTQLKPISIVFTISQDDIPRVQKRFQEGHELRVDAYDRGFTTKLASGKLLATDNQVDPATGTLRLKAIVDEDQTRLFPNQFVNTRLLVDMKENAIVVPSAAVQRGPNSNFVYVVKDDETVELRNVVIGPAEGAETSIESGLEEGEIVVTDGIDKLQPGAKVSTRDPNAKGEQSEGKKGKGSGKQDFETKNSEKAGSEKSSAGTSGEGKPAAR